MRLVQACGCGVGKEQKKDEGKEQKIDEVVREVVWSGFVRVGRTRAHAKWLDRGCHVLGHRFTTNGE